MRAAWNSRQCVVYSLGASSEKAQLMFLGETEDRGDLHG